MTASSRREPGLFLEINPVFCDSLGDGSERFGADREFDSMDVFQTLSNLDVNYLIPKRITSTELTPDVQKLRPVVSMRMAVWRSS